MKELKLRNEKECRSFVLLLLKQTLFNKLYVALNLFILVGYLLMLHVDYFYLLCLTLFLYGVFYKVRKSYISFNHSLIVENGKTFILSPNKKKKKILFKDIVYIENEKSYYLIYKTFIVVRALPIFRSFDDFELVNFLKELKKQGVAKKYIYSKSLGSYYYSNHNEEVEIDE